MTGTVPIRLDEIQGWLGSGAAVVGVRRRVPLTGGRTAPVVERVSVAYTSAGSDGDGPWLVVPFQPGKAIGSMTEPPAAVYAALARLHVQHLGRTDELPPAAAERSAEMAVVMVDEAEKAIERLGRQSSRRT